MVMPSIAGSGFPPELRFICVDEGRQRLFLYGRAGATLVWELDLTAYPLARDLQRLGENRVLVGFDRGYLEIELSTGRILTVEDRFRNVTAARRLGDGVTRLTGLDLDGQGGVSALELGPDGSVLAARRRPGDYVRLARPTPEGSWLLSTDDHVLETDAELRELRRLSAPGFRHAWLARREADGSTLVSAGYGAFMARFDPAGALLATFGRKEELPPEAEPNFYACHETLADGSILVANWQGHGPDQGSRGRQLLRFSAAGEYLGSWSDPARISSLQGILVLEWGA